MAKVCFVTTVHQTISAFLLEVAQYLNNAGVNVTFVCNADEAFEKSLPDYVRFLPVTMKRGTDPRGIVSICQLYKIFKREKFDLIQYSTPNASFYASIAAFLARADNRLYAQWGIYYIGSRGWKRRVFELLERVTCSLSTHVQPISPLNREFGIAHKLYPREKSSVVGKGSVKGIDFGKFDIEKKQEYRQEVRAALKIGADSMVFGYIGRITRDKGFNELLRAYQRYRSCNSCCDLVVCGEEDASPGVDPQIYQWAREEDSVHFCGTVKDPEKYFAGMDIFVFPTYREGFGEVALEAQAMGVPVITTNVPGPYESVKENCGGVHVDPCDSGALFSAMEKLSRDPALLKDMGVCARRWAEENFDSRVLIPQICEMKLKMAGIKTGPA